MKVSNVFLPVTLLLGSLSGYSSASQYEDSEHYNYVGIDINADLFGLDTELVGAVGGGMSVGYLHTSSVFSKFNVRMSGASEDQFTEVTGFKQSYNAQLGLKKSSTFFTPYIMGGIGYNRLSGEVGQQNWMMSDVELGLKTKLKIDYYFNSYTDISYLFGVTNYEDQLRTVSGLNVEMGVIAFEKVNVYGQFKGIVSNNIYDETTPEDEQIGMFIFSAGIKYSY